MTTGWSPPAAPWERRLLSLACAPLKQTTDVPSVSRTLVHGDQATLDRAYARCAQVTVSHSRTFYLASGLLPPGKRQAARALYAFCRISDDLVDRANRESAEAQLEAWRTRALEAPPAPGDLIALAWADARARYGIPMQYAHQLVDGVAQDIRVKRYETFDALAEYAYCVASTVGLMAMHITGFSDKAAVPYAVKLGVALQLTNILRDVGEDWQQGRLYLPQNELTAFDLREADIAAGRVDDRWRALMRFQIARTRQLYAEAWPGIGLLHRDGRLAIGAAAELYRAILADIEAHDYDVFTRRAHLSQWDKLRRLPGIWWRIQNVYSYHV